VSAYLSRRQSQWEPWRIFELAYAPLEVVDVGRAGKVGFALFALEASDIVGETPEKSTDEIPALPGWTPHHRAPPIDGRAPRAKRLAKALFARPSRLATY
jgi:hypothetical protein